MSSSTTITVAATEMDGYGQPTANMTIATQTLETRLMSLAVDGSFSTKARQPSQNSQKSQLHAMNGQTIRS
jgi:hypothetical protein